jgi:hypothetical protein
MTKLRITLGNLPLRSRPLGEKELAEVFGGCIGSGVACGPSCQCCAGLVCSNGTCRAASADAAL